MRGADIGAGTCSGVLVLTRPIRLVVVRGFAEVSAHRSQRTQPMPYLRVLRAASEAACACRAVPAGCHGQQQREQHTCSAAGVRHDRGTEGT